MEFQTKNKYYRRRVMAIMRQQIIRVRMQVRLIFVILFFFSFFSTEVLVCVRFKFLKLRKNLFKKLFVQNGELLKNISSFTKLIL